MINRLVQAQVTQRSRGALLLRGVLSIIFGLIALFDPGIALLALVIVFGAYALLDGILAIAVAIQEHNTLPHWGWLFVEGLAGIALGIIAFVWPIKTALILLFIVAIWAVVTGVLEIVAALKARSWMVGFAGLLSVAFGILLFVHPGAGLLSVLWILGIYALVFGILLVVHAFQLPLRSPSSGRVGEMNF